MRAALVLLFLILPVSAVHAQSVSSLAATGVTVPAEVWTPLRVFVGTWAAKRLDANGTVKVVRDYKPVLNNQHLQVTEDARGSAQPWGLISYDAGKQGFVLRHFATDGSAQDLAYDSAASTDKELVFASAPEAGNVRVSYRLVSWNEFVEKIERGDAAATETTFKRKH